MKKNILYLAFFIVMGYQVNAQMNLLEINDDIVMLEDSLENEALLFSVNGFLSLAQNDSQNKWILPSERVGTQILIDEIIDIQKSEKFENDSFFKPCLTNIIPLEENKYKVKVSYIGIHENSPILRASFELIAHKNNDNFLISSPLLRNTQNWNSKKIEKDVFYYPYTLNEEKAQEFTNQVRFYDEKLKINSGALHHYYLCKDETNPLKLFGVEYKSDYNGDDIETSWISTQDKKMVLVQNESLIYEVDMHDLWHGRLRQVIPRNKVHRGVECQIATLYGGIWGISWEDLFPMFCEKFVIGKNVDWLEHKKNRAHFITKETRKNFTNDFVGALLVRKIEKEKGFDGVWELLTTKRTKEDKEYFDTLEKLTGISKKNYNKKAQKLIDEEMKKMGL